MCEFVASCSTLPGRVNNIRFQETVLKFANNPKITKVYIQYPRHCVRLKLDYPPVPDWMHSNKKIFVNKEAEDTGPSTKFHSLCELLPANKPKLGVILFDDDRIYTDKWINDLMDAYDMHKGEVSVAYQGTLSKTMPFQIDKYNIPKKINNNKNSKSYHKQFIVAKTAGLAIYCRKVFPSTNQVYKDLLEKYKDNKIRNNDDIGLAHLAYKAVVPIMLIPIQHEQYAHWLDVNNDGDNSKDSLSLIPDHIAPQIKLAKAMITNGDLPVPYIELTTVVVCSVTLLLLIAICIMVGIMYKKK